MGCPEGHGDQAYAGVPVCGVGKTFFGAFGHIGPCKGHTEAMLSQ